MISVSLAQPNILYLASRHKTPEVNVLIPTKTSIVTAGYWVWVCLSFGHI